MHLKNNLAASLVMLAALISAPVQALIITDKLEVLLIPDVGDTFQTITAQQTYATDMVVVCTNVLVSNADNEVAVRIQNVGTNSFDILLQNPEGDPVTDGDVYCLLSEEGVFTLPDGTIFEAHTVESDGTHGWRRTTVAGVAGWNGVGGVNGSEDVSASIMGAYAANSQPAVLGQVMTYNDTGYSVFHSFDCESRSRPPFTGDDTDTLSDGICVGKHVGKTPAVDSDRDPETVGYIVMEQAGGLFDGITYQAALGADSVAGVDSSPPYTYVLGAHFDFGVATQEGEDGSQGGWAVLYGADPLDGNNIDLAIEEDTTIGNRTHTNEQVAYWVFSGTDHSDADVSYGDASHMVIGVLSLGPSTDGDADSEAAANTSADATGDDNDGIDDEDGVVFRSPAVSGDSIFADVEVTNPKGLAVTVCAWLDIPSGGSVDGVFDASDGVCQSTSAVNPTLTFQWAGLPTDQPYTTFSRFRVTSDTMTTADAVTVNSLAATATDGEVEDYQVVFDFTPTAVTIGQVNINSIAIANFLTGVGTDDIDTQGLFDLLQNIDPSTTLEPSASQAEIEKALNDYLDPDEDGQVIVFSWDTLEQRGSIGFYAERRQADGSWYRINDSLLPAIIAAPMGAEYQLVDRTASLDQADSATGNYEYRLIELEANGTMREYGPFNLSL